MNYAPAYLPPGATGYLTGECINSKRAYIGNIRLHGESDGFIAMRDELWEDFNCYGKDTPRLQQGQLIDFGPYRLRYVSFYVSTMTKLFVLEGRLWPAMKYWIAEWVWMVKFRCLKTAKIWFPKGLD